MRSRVLRFAVPALAVATVLAAVGEVSAGCGRRGGVGRRGGGGCATAGGYETAGGCGASMTHAPPAHSFAPGSTCDSCNAGGGVVALPGFGTGPPAAFAQPGFAQPGAALPMPRGGVEAVPDVTRALPPTPADTRGQPVYAAGPDGVLRQAGWLKDGRLQPLSEAVNPPAIPPPGRP